MLTQYAAGVEDGKTIFHVIEFEWSYTQLTSLNAFFRRMTKAYLKVGAEPGIRNKYNWDRASVLDFVIGQNPSRKVIHHKSVWDFYEHIGYDYKKSTSNKVVLR